MLALNINIHLIPLLGLLIAAFFVGFIIRSGQLKSNRKKINELEKEMLSNHAEILKLQKEKADMLRR